MQNTTHDNVILELEIASCNSRSPFAAVALIFLAFAEMGQLCEESYAEKEKSKTDYPS